MVQLINYVMMSFHVYWAQAYIMPKRVLHEIANICIAFHWVIRFIAKSLTMLFGSSFVVGNQFEVSVSRLFFHGMWLTWGSVCSELQLIKTMLGLGGFIQSIFTMLIGGSFFFIRKRHDKNYWWSILLVQGQLVFEQYLQWKGAYEVAFFLNWVMCYVKALTWKLYMLRR